MSLLLLWLGTQKLNSTLLINAEELKTQDKSPGKWGSPVSTHPTPSTF